MRKRRKNTIAVVTFFLLLICGTAIVVFLKENTHQASKLNNQVAGQEHIAQVPSSEVTSTSSTPESSSESESAPFNTVPLQLSDDSLVHNLSKDELSEVLQDIQTQDYQHDLLNAQSDIVAAINKHRQNISELGYLFLPQKPAEVSQLQNVKQLDIPLYLQKDPKWRTLQYGTDTTRQLGENGCAILSLAMIHAYYNPQATVTPQTILDWSKDQYYVHNQGTSWNIFYDFAQSFNYQFTNFGNNFEEAMQAVNQGQAIVATVKPGLFTETGHILVIRGYQDGQVYVNDPNDDPSKMFSIKAIPAQTMMEEGVNYWALSK